MVSKLNTTDLLAYGLIGCWKLNEGTGTTAYDLTTNANNGTLNGGVRLGDPTGLIFDGANDSVNVGNAANLNVDSMTIAEIGRAHV